MGRLLYDGIENGRTTSWMNTVTFLLLIPFVEGATLFSASTLQCQARCTDRSIAFPLPRDSFAWPSDLFKECDADCRRAACELGCSDLENVVQGCDTRCAAKADSPSSTESCVQGCHALEHAFLSHLQELLNTVAVSIEMDDSGVHLLWKFPESAQTQLHELSTRSARWLTHSRSATGVNDGWKWNGFTDKPFSSSLNASVVLPTQSSPQLQVRLAVAWNGRVAVSPAVSYQISTRFLSSELAPTAQLQTAADAYALCWRSNRIQATFRVTLTTLDGNAISSDETNERCHQLQNLPRENCCRVTVADVFPEKVKPPPSNTTMSTPEDVVKEEKMEKKTLLSDLNDNPKGDQFTIKIDMVPAERSAEVPSVLVFTNGSNVLLLENVDDYVMSNNPSLIPFNVDDDDSITALSGVSSSIMVVGTEKGALWLLQLDNTESESDANETSSTEASIKPITLRSPKKSLRDADGAAIKDIAFDSMQRCVYAVLSTKGVIRCSLSPSPCTFYASDPINPITALAVDSWNGFIYMINTNKDVYQAELFPFNATDVYSFVSLKKIPAISPALVIEMNYVDQQLIAVLENGTVVRRDLIASNTRIVREGAGFAKVKSFRVSGDRLFWTKEKCGETPLDEVCFYSEEAAKAGATEIHFSRYLYSGRIVDLAFLRDPILPPLIMAPSHIGLAVSATQARVTWMPPQSLPFQAPGALWRNVVYEVKLEAMNGTLIADVKMSNTDLVVTVSPSHSYTASVRACTRGICSLYIYAINKAFAETNDHPVYIVKKGAAEGCELYDVIGQPSGPDPSLDSLVLPKDIESALVFENYTRSALVSIDNPPGIGRQPPSSNISTPFLPGLTVRHLTLLSSRATLVTAYHYHIASYRLTGTVDSIVHSCPLDAVDCPEVMAVAADDEKGDIYYLLHHPNSTVHLYVLARDKRSPDLISSSNDFPQIRQLVVSHDRLMFVTRHGRMGFCDKKLDSLNINYALAEVALLVPIFQRDPNTNLTTFDFSGNVAMSERNKLELTWSVEPKLPPNGVLYHVVIYKDKLGSADSRNLFTLTPSVILPLAVLDTWSSGQHFDVSIQGQSALQTVSINKTGLIAPTKPPTKPQKLLIYATQQKTVDGPRAIISLFWNPPADWNGNAFQYIVNCTQEGGVNSGGIVPSSHLYYSFAVKSGKVNCAVAAANEPKNVGEFSEVAEIDSSELRPLVRLFAIDSANSLISITNITAEMASVRKRRQLGKIEYEALAFIGNDLYAVRREPDTTQILLVQIDTNQIENTVHKVSIGGDVSRIDAMTSDWVGHRLLFVAGKSLYQIALDPFLSTSILTPRKLIDLSPGAADAKQLTYDPFTNTAYLLTRNGSLFSLSLLKGHEENLALTMEGLSSRTITWMMAEFSWNQASSPQIYALTWNGMITIDTQARKLDDLQIDWSKFGERGLKSISAFSIADKLFVFVTSSEMLIYGKDSIVPISIANPPLRQILAVSQSSQPFPERACFSLPSSSTIDFKMVNEGRTGALIEVSPPPPRIDCGPISMPSTQYDVYFTRKGTDKVKHVRSFSETIHVENGILDKETAYEVTVAWSNRYSPASGVSSSRAFRTGFGYPSSPRDPFAVPISPDTLYLFWRLPETLNAPKKEIKYKISQQSLSSPSQIAVQEWNGNSFIPTTSDHAGCLNTPCRVRVTNLRPSTDYKFWVTAIHESRLNSPFPGDSEASSMDFSTRTKDVAGTLRPDNITGSSILLKWTSLQPADPPTVVSIQYKEEQHKEPGGNGEWRSPTNATFDGSIPSLSILLNNLLAATSYSFRFVAVYASNYTAYGIHMSFKEDYYQAQQLAKTRAGTPTAPQEVEARVDEKGWIVQWSEPQSDGGSPVTSYAVEVRVNETAEWEIAERGLDAFGPKVSWRPARTDADTFSWQFRVRAANQEGFGAYGYTSSDTPHTLTTVNDDNVFVFVVTIVIMTIIGLIAAALLLVRHRLMESNGKKKKVDNKSITLEKMADFSATSNNVSASLQNEIKNLPRIRRNDITLGPVLGTGFFGKVYKAVATELPLTGDKNAEVAVKILRENHTAEDRVRFLKEAILMNNFDHPNIVKLLGVCLEEDQTPCIVKEHMLGGDLYTFLRNSRKSTPPSLSLRDLLSIMIDIARGCSYLEQNKHIQRELAARNCYLSSSESTSRITKIAHLGITKGCDDPNSLVESGDALRWLSPESLSSGIFDGKTVVWSYGVVVYEILTLGARPYDHIRTDCVRESILAGEILDRPHYCPQKIFKVAQSCWSESDERPSFSDLLPLLETFREQPEFQDDKPYAAGGGSGGVESGEGRPPASFDNSTSSSASSSTEAEGTSGGGQQSSNANSTGSGNAVSGARKQQRPSIRSLRNNKPGPLQVWADDSTGDLPAAAVSLPGRPSPYFGHPSTSHPPSPQSQFAHSSDAFNLSPSDRRQGTSSFYSRPTNGIKNFAASSRSSLQKSLSQSQPSPPQPIFPSYEPRSGLFYDNENDDGSLSHSWAASQTSTPSGVSMTDGKRTSSSSNRAQGTLPRNGAGLLLAGAPSSSTGMLNGTRRVKQPAPPPPATVVNVTVNGPREPVPRKNSMPGVKVSQV